MRLSILDLLVELAADDGVFVSPSWLFDDTARVLTLDRPSGEPVGELNSRSAAACDLLLQQVRHQGVAMALGSRHTALVVLRASARVVGALLPPVMADVFGRFAVPLEADALAAETALRHAVDALAYLLNEHDAGTWVNPEEVAGAVADVHDAAHALVVITDLFGEPPIGC